MGISPHESATRKLFNDNVHVLDPHSRDLLYLFLFRVPFPYFHAISLVQILLVLVVAVIDVIQYMIIVY